MNIHPIFVHFPIALLSLYAITELIRPRALVSSPAWKRIKQILLVTGVLGAYAALGTGEFGEAEFRSARAIISVHETFAGLTTTIFSILLVFYVIDESWSYWGPR